MKKKKKKERQIKKQARERGYIICYIGRTKSERRLDREASARAKATIKTTPTATPMNIPVRNDIVLFLFVSICMYFAIFGGQSENRVSLVEQSSGDMRLKCQKESFFSIIAFLLCSKLFLLID